MKIINILLVKNNIRKIINRNINKDKNKLNFKTLKNKKSIIT